MGTIVSGGSSSSHTFPDGAMAGELSAGREILLVIQ